jgi:hypothetical protein
MKRLEVAALLVAFVALAAAAPAQDKAKAPGKPDPNGTWKWTVEFGGNTREMSMKLKQEGEKLTGTMSGFGNEEAKIEDGKYKDGDLSFRISRDFGGNQFVIKYSGKVTGDEIKGKAEFDFDGNAQSMDWNPKREKAK